MKILKLTAENIKKLRVVSITPSGSVVQITGPNASGKTSVLDSIYYALAGAKDIPSQPIRRGQLKAHVTLELGEITVTRKFSKDSGTSLVVEAKSGARFPTPQRMLDDLLGKLTFDPLAFSRMDPKKQLEQLRAMVKLDVDIEALDQANARDFEERTNLNREVKKLDAQGHGIMIAADTPDEAIDIDELVKDLETAGKKNAEIERAKANRAKLDRTIQDVKTKASDARQAAEHYRDEAEKLDEEAEKLIREGLALQEQAKEFTIPDPVDTSEIRTLIDQARSINQEVLKKKNQTTIFQNAKRVRGEVEKLEEAMQARTTAKMKAVAAAKMPIEGLSFGNGEVTYNDLPFAQSSSAEQLRISVAIAMAANPKLRVLRIQDGSLLDGDGMKMLEQMADLADYQVWIERVDTSGKVGIVMEDGEVVDAGIKK